MKNYDFEHPPKNLFQGGPTVGHFTQVRKFKLLFLVFLDDISIKRFFTLNVQYVLSMYLSVIVLFKEKDGTTTTLKQSTDEICCFRRLCALRDPEQNKTLCEKRYTISLLQLVWKSTKKVGVSVVAIQRGFYTKTYIVARYTPIGNVEGEFGREVGTSVMARK